MKEQVENPSPQIKESPVQIARFENQKQDSKPFANESRHKPKRGTSNTKNESITIPNPRSNNLQRWPSNIDGVSLCLYRPADVCFWYYNKTKEKTKQEMNHD